MTKAEQPPKFVAPGPAVNASAIKGKTVVEFPINNQIDACNTQSQDYAALGKQLGLNVKTISDSGEPTQWGQAIQDAVSDHAAAVVMLCGVIPGAVGPQLAAAQKAGVKVIDGNYNETSDYSGLDAEVGVDTAESLKNDVDLAYTNLNGQPLHAIMVTSSSVIQGPAATAAVKAAVSSACSSCSVDKTIDVPVQDWTTATEGDVDTALQSDPQANAVFVAFDGMAQFAATAVKQINRSGLEVYAWGAGRSVESEVQQGNSDIAADAGPDEDWDSYEAMDQTIRLLSGQPAAPVGKEVVPDRLWVSSNVGSFFGPNNSYGNEGYGGNNFINGFDKLWGVSSTAGS